MYLNGEYQKYTLSSESIKKNRKKLVTFLSTRVTAECRCIQFLLKMSKVGQTIGLTKRQTDPNTEWPHYCTSLSKKTIICISLLHLL